MFTVRKFVHDVARSFADDARHPFDAQSPREVNGRYMRQVALWYMLATSEMEPETIAQWGRFRDIIWAQFEALSARITFDFVDYDPISNALQIHEHIDTEERLPVWHSKHTGGHPVLTDDENNAFRAVHDVMGHYLHRVSFDANGEDTAYRGHALTMPRDLWPVLATETRGQNAALNFGDPIGAFKEQKVVLAPAFVTRF